jgi:hypothetical protein
MSDVPGLRAPDGVRGAIPRPQGDGLPSPRKCWMRARLAAREMMPGGPACSSEGPLGGQGMGGTGNVFRSKAQSLYFDRPGAGRAVAPQFGSPRRTGR